MSLLRKGAISRIRALIEALIDSYEENLNSAFNLDDVHPSEIDTSAAGQTFRTPSTRYKITKVKFSLFKMNNPTCNLEARLYEIEGTFGVNAVPTGSPLATSEPVNASVLGETPIWLTFIFSSSQQYLMEANHYYAIIFVPTTQIINGQNVVRFEYSDPGTHEGNMCVYDNGSWIAAEMDVGFRVYGRR